MTCVLLYVASCPSIRVSRSSGVKPPQTVSGVGTITGAFVGESTGAGSVGEGVSGASVGFL